MRRRNHPSSTRPVRGFTIVELLVVIVVIAILAAITIVSYNGIQQRARAVAIVNSIKAIDKAFRLYGTVEGWSSWPQDNTIVSGQSNVTIPSIISNVPEFAENLQSVPSVPGMTLSYWYDNDLDAHDPNTCTATTGKDWKGANLGVKVLTQDMMLAVDKAMDDGDLTCGRVRDGGNSGMLIYQMSYTQDF